MTMKVLLNYFDAPGMFGMKRYSLELAHALRLDGVEVRLRASRIHEARLGPLRVGGLVTRAARNHVPVRGRRSVDLVHATDHKSNPHPAAQVVTVHDLIPYESVHLVGGSARWKQREERAAARAVRTASRILTDSRHVREQLLRWFGASPDQVEAVHLGVRHDLFFPDPGTAADLPFRPGMLNVLLAVRTEPRKRADAVLEAAASLPFVNVVHVGGDRPHRIGERHMAEVAEATARLEREGRWARLPSVDDAMLRRLLTACDVFVHPSLAEGFSLPPVEALACGARVLASDIPVHREVLAGMARLASVDVPSLAAELERMWDGEGPRDAGFARIEDRLAHARTFTWERTAAATRDCYAEAMRLR